MRLTHFLLSFDNWLWHGDAQTDGFLGADAVLLLQLEALVRRHQVLRSLHKGHLRIRNLHHLSYGGLVWNHTSRPVSLLKELLLGSGNLLEWHNHLLFTGWDLRSAHVSRFLLLHHRKDLILHERSGRFGALTIGLGGRIGSYFSLVPLSVLLYVSLSHFAFRKLSNNALLDSRSSIFSADGILTCSACTNSHHVLTSLRLRWEEILRLARNFQQRLLHKAQVLKWIAL